MMHLFNGNTNFHSFIPFDQMTEQYRLPGICTDRLFISRSITYKKRYYRRRHHHHCCNRRYMPAACVCHNIYAVVRNNNNHHNNIIILCITLPIKWDPISRIHNNKFNDQTFSICYLTWNGYRTNWTSPPPSLPCYVWLIFVKLMMMLQHKHTFRSWICNVLPPKMWRG